MKRIIGLTAVALIALAGCSGTAAESIPPSTPIVAETVEPSPEQITSEPSPVPTDPQPRDEQQYLDQVLFTNTEAQYLETEQLIEMGDQACEEFDKTGDAAYVLDSMYKKDADYMNRFGLSIIGSASTYLCSRYFTDVANYVLEHDDVQVTGGVYGDGN